MKEDDSKMDEDQEIIYDSLLKVDTVEGQCVYMISQGYTRDVQPKSNVKFGLIYVYTELNKHVALYKGDITNASMNQEIYWDQKYFDKIRVVQDTGGHDYKYSFKSDDDLEFVLKINERIHLSGSKKQLCSEALILRVSMRLLPQLSFLDSLFQMFLTIHSRKQLKLTVQIQEVQKLDKSRLELLQELERINQVRRRQETDIQNKCVYLLNKKKSKIRDLYQQKEVSQSQQIYAITNSVQNSTNDPSNAQQVDKIAKLEPTTQQEVHPRILIQISPPGLSSLFEKDVRTTNVMEIVAKQEDDEVEHVEFEEYMEFPRKKIK